MRAEPRLAQTLISYRTFELLGALITIVAVGISVYLYLESIRRSMEDLKQEVIETLDTVVMRVDHAYDNEAQRDADWLKQDTDDTKEILTQIEEMESTLLEYIGTIEHDEAYQRGMHEGYHAMLTEQLGRIEHYLNECGGAP